jgi:hypothetical protein
MGRSHSFISSFSGMRQLFLKIGLLALPVLVLLVIHRWKFPEEDFSVHHKKAQLFETGAQQTEILVLGTSHAVEGILPAELHPKAFNLAHPSQQAHYDAKLFDYAIKKSAPIKLVLVAVSPFTASHKPLTHSDAKWTAYRYYSAYGEPLPDWRMYLEFKAHHAFFRENRIFGLKEWFFVGSKVGARLDGQGGFMGFDGSLSKRPLHEVKAISEAVALKHQKNTKGPDEFEAKEAWSQLLQLAATRGSKVVFFSLPTSPAYRAAMAPWAESAARNITGLLSNYPCALWRDYSALIPTTLSDFNDPDHLNRQGAKKFTHALRDALLSEGLLPN